MQNSRDLVKAALTFQRPDRIPRQTWMIPAFTDKHPEAVAELKALFPPDVVRMTTEGVYHPSPRVRGDCFSVGHYIDEWGCDFENIFQGVIGEVRQPMVGDEDDFVDKVKPPYEILPQGEIEIQKARDAINRAYAQSDKFLLCGAIPRPWERYQFLRGSENSYMDVMEPEEMQKRLKVIHDYYMRELELWAGTDVDSLSFMDDWGSQTSLLINPILWRELFKPLYKDYCDMAKAAGKSIFMHSDGFIEAIYPDLIELGVTAINSQVFCMNIEDLGKKYKGKITFWGEIDRQHVLCSPDLNVGTQAVKRFMDNLWSPEGGVIALFDCTGANPKMPRHIYECFDRESAERTRTP